LLKHRQKYANFVGRLSRNMWNIRIQAKLP